MFIKQRCHGVIQCKYILEPTKLYDIDLGTGNPSNATLDLFSIAWDMI